MTWSPRNRTDDGSEDGDEKVDEEAREDDDISIGECFSITGLLVYLVPDHTFLLFYNIELSHNVTSL